MRNRYKFFTDIGGDTIEFPVNPDVYKRQVQSVVRRDHEDQ